MLYVNNSSSDKKYNISFSFQLLLTVILTVYVVRRARSELDRMMEEDAESKLLGDKAPPHSPVSNNNNKKDIFCHKRNSSNTSYTLIINEDETSPTHKSNSVKSKPS